jgi:site-specific DNA-methyltransferase (adenine-specific)
MKKYSGYRKPKTLTFVIICISWMNCWTQEPDFLQCWKKVNRVEIDKIIQGNTLDVLRTMPAKSVNCIITSPPYWSLRSYKTEGVIWDGDPNCQHDFEIHTIKHSGGKKGKIPDNPAHFESQSQFCSLCGAWKGELGSEPTFSLYIVHLVSIFEEAKRVLRDDGCLFVNLGDTYASSGSLESRFYHGKNQGKHQLGDGDGLLSKEYSGRGRTDEVKAKSLCLIPERFAIAMVDAGFILRNVLIWHKINAMPSSAKDRFSPDFEFIYFFTKSKKYYFEQIFEPIKMDSVMRNRRGQNKGKWHDKDAPKGFYQTLHKERDFTGYEGIEEELENSQGRNKRCVWSIPTKSLRLKHYAAFPETLVEPMILAGTPGFVCSKCGKPRRKIYEYPGGVTGKGFTDHENDDEMGLHRVRHPKKDDEPYMRKETGYTDCGCNAPFDSGIVLDIFMGAGTTAVVAKKLNRHWLGIELNPEYIKMAEKRIKHTHVQQTLF